MLPTNRLQSRRGIGMPGDELHQHVQEPGLPLQKRGRRVFQAQMHLLDQVGKATVVDDAGGEKGQGRRPAGHLGGRPLQQLGPEIEHPVGPAVLGGRLAGMHLVRVDEVDPAGGGDDMFAAVEKAQGPPFDHPDAEALMGVAGEGLGQIGGPHQLEPGQAGRMPDVDLFGRGLPPAVHPKAACSVVDRVGYSASSRRMASGP